MLVTSCQYLYTKYNDNAFICQIHLQICLQPLFKIKVSTKSFFEKFAADI